MKYKIFNIDKRPDNNGDSFENCVVVCKKTELLITLYFRNEIEFVVGNASLIVEEDAVYAEIKFNTKDDIKIQMYKELAPCIGAAVLEREENVVKKIEIKSISLDILNNDPRIHSLKGQENVKQIS